MAATSEKIPKTKRGCLGWAPSAASVAHYSGTLCFLTPSGYATPIVGSAFENTLGGLVLTSQDNSAGAAGDKKVEFERGLEVLLTGSGFSQASVGQPVYASDNYTITLDPAAGVRCGIVTEYVSSTQVYVRLGEDLPQVIKRSVTFDAASVNANTTAEQDVTVTGAKTGDRVICQMASMTAGLAILGAYVSAADTVKVTYGNFTGGAINQASGTMLVTLFR